MLLLTRSHRRHRWISAVETGDELTHRSPQSPRMDTRDPASVAIRLTDDVLRGTLVEEQSDGWLIDEESNRLIHVYSQEVD